MSNRDSGIIEYMIALLRFDEDDNEPTEADRQRRYRAAVKVLDFIDEIPGGFMIYKADKGEEIVYANKALIKMFKCDSCAEFKALTNYSFKGIVHPDDLQAVEASIIKQIQSSSDDLDYVEYRIVPKDGIVRWVEDYGHFVHRGEAGDFYYVFITDATEKVTRQLAERATLINDKRAKEKQLNELIEEYDKERRIIGQEHLRRLEVIEGLSVNYDSILFADLDSNKVLPYRLSARTEVQFDGKLQVRELEWFLNEYVSMWVHPDDRERVAEFVSTAHMRKTLCDRQSYHINYRCVLNGEIQYLQLRIVNVGDGDGVSQVVMGFSDISEEVSREVQQKQILEVALGNAKLAEVAKNTFLSNMSHDMRTPLNAIFGYTSLAKKKVDDPDAVLAALDKIETATREIFELVDKVLEITYIETQERTVDEEECNVCDIANDVYSAALPQAERKNIKVNVRTSVKHKTVFTDRQKLQQSLNHIVNNAVKYTPRGGRVDISVSERSNSNKISEFATFVFTIKDTGIGIAEADLARIFEPFERVANTTASGVHGSGLGLTIANGLIESLGGNLAVKSVLGEGSKFIVTLALRVVKRVTDVAAEEVDTDDMHGIKILIVEDNELNLEIETEILEEQGFIIDTAVNGQIAVDKVKASSPGEYKLILMDIQMPVLDGRSAAREIRALDNIALASIPIIALSANAFASDKRASLDAGMDAHLTKPIDVPVLLNAIKKTLKTRKNRSPRNTD